MRHRGFSLVELLVCMTIVVVLITLALPALRGPRESARRTGCLVNLRGVGQGLAGFIGDREALPRASRLMRDPERVELVSALEPYVGGGLAVGGGFRRGWVCPSDPARARVEGSYRYSAADVMNPPVWWFDPYRVPLLPNVGRVALLWYESEPGAELLLDVEAWHTRQPRPGTWHGFNVLYLDGAAIGR